MNISASHLQKRISARVEKIVQSLSCTLVNWCDRRLMSVSRNYRLTKFPVIKTLLKFGADFFRLLPHLLLGFSGYELSNSQWKIVFLGSQRGLQELSCLFFGEDCQCRHLGNFKFYAIRRAMRRWLANQTDLVVCEASNLISWFLEADIALTSPLWFEMLLPLPDDPEELLAGRKKASIRNKINRFLRNGFYYKYCRREEDFQDFYQRMYVPFVTSRHKELARVTPASTQSAWWMRRGGILQVCLKDEALAGTICYVDDCSCYAIETGVVTSGDSFFRQGINDFSFWCIICWAHENGARCLNLGGTRPFRSNGSFRHKSLWGAYPAIRLRSSHAWHFLGRDIGPALQNRLNELKLICQVGSKLYSAYFVPHTDGIKVAEINGELEQARREGFEGLLLASGRKVTLLTEPLPPDDAAAALPAEDCHATGFKKTA